MRSVIATYPGRRNLLFSSRLRMRELGRGTSLCSQHRSVDSGSKCRMSATSRDLSESQMSDAKVTNHVRSQYRSTVHYPRSRPEGNLHNTSLRAALEWDSQPPRTVPQSVPLSSTAKELHSQFRSGKRNPAEVVRERIASDTLDMETARLCVTGHVERAMRYPRRIREAMCRSDRMGGTVLYWLWEKDE